MAYVALTASALAVACADLKLVSATGAAGGGTPSSSSGASSSHASSGIVQTGSATASSTTSSSSSSTSGATTTACSSSTSSSSSSSGAPDVLFGTIVTGGDSTDSHPPGLSNINSYVATKNGMVGHLSAYLRTPYQGPYATTVYLGLYADSGGMPSTLLTKGTIQNPDWCKITDDGGDWYTAAVPQVSVTANSTYWIAILAPHNAGGWVGFGFFNQAGGTYWQHSFSSTLDVLPQTWTADMSMMGNYSECSMYATP
jgi:hypothetical protein